MEYTDDGDSESELLGPVQESLSQQVQDNSSEQDEPPGELPPSYFQQQMRPEQPDSRGITSYTKFCMPQCSYYIIMARIQ